MRILFVADGRSPITVNWLRYFVERGDEVFLASTFAGQPDLKLNGLEIIPVAFSGAKSVSTPTPKMPGQAEPGQAGAAGSAALRPWVCVPPSDTGSGL